MNKRLFFVCPTDFLEGAINDEFKGENYFINSLGNSIAFNTEMVDEINALVETKGIKEITFVLSDENRIFDDVSGSQQFSELTGMSNFYDEITNENKGSLLLWQTENLNKIALSNHLNKKVQELESKLSNWLVDNVKVGAKLYCSEEQSFKQIHGDLLKLEFSLN